MNSKEQLEQLRQAIGVMAESSYLFYKDVIRAGASPSEAMQLTQAYMASMLKNNKGEE